LPPAEIVAAGFPCQDISAAGKGAGLAGARSGLWYECARIIAESRPAWVVIENVASGAKRWVDAVRGSLGQLGYETLPIPISAADVGAPHLRRRVFIIAHAIGFGLRDEWQRQSRRRAHGVRPQRHSEPAHTSSTWPAANKGWPLGPRVCGVDDGLSTRMDRDRLKALGNAVVPQCAQVVGEIINLLRKDTA
jgi:DNA (cytosine-5)-methyltransferase 1